MFFKPNEVTTKHIFVGTTRIVTKLSHKNPASESNDISYEKANVYTYHPDHLGSTHFVTDVDGKEYEHNEFTPYGEVFINEGDSLDKIAFGFTSKELDQETGLIYFGARYLDPKIARFMSIDPAMDGENWYGYGKNNPIKYNDPTGMISENTSLGQQGEQNMVRLLLERGFIVADVGKHPNTTGPDIIAYKNGFIHIIDNKESLKAGKIIYSVKGFQNQELFQTWLSKTRQTILQSNLSSQEKATLLKALNNKKISLTVSTSGTNIKGIGPKLSKGINGFKVNFLKGTLISLYALPFITAGFRLNKLMGELSLIRSGDLGSEETQFRLQCLENYFKIDGNGFKMAVTMGLANFNSAEEYINTIWEVKKHIVSPRIEDKLL